MKTATATSRYKVQVLDRTFAILQAVADAASDCTAVDISKRLRLHKSTVHPLLVSLQHHGLVNRNRRGGYRLGTRTILLGNCAVARLNLRDRATPILRDLALKTGEGAHVTVVVD